MDIHLKQWRNQQHESEEHNAAKMPKLLFDPHLHSHQQKQQESSSGSDALRPLFEPQLNNKTCNLSAFPNSPTRFSGMGSYFSLAQWQELELQALIYRYMLAGAAVPPELLNTIQKSLLHSAPYFIHYPLQHYSHYQPALVQAGYWGKGSMDPEPGRCRRTDGKKWRCSRDVVTGQKYCERHVHRGRNRSRKPVELPTPTTSASGGADGGSALGSSNSVANTGFGGGTGFTLSGQSPSIDLLKLNRSSSESKTENKVPLEAHNEVHDKADGHILRHFFDDWPPSIQQAEVGGSNASPPSSTTFLTISMPGNSSSDVSLKLSTGNGDERCPEECEREPPLHLNWAWAGNQVASMGGPLAEALRSSTSNSSPTSVLHQLHRGSVSDKSSFVCS